MFKKRFMTSLLSVGDALVWRRLGYDRASITVLGQGSRVIWLSDGRGWDAELLAVEQLWHDGVFAMLTDATTCISTGDLVCFFADRVEIREVKAGRMATVASPQMLRMAQAVDLINLGRAEHDGHDRVLIRGHALPRRNHPTTRGGSVWTCRR